jgi:hypothetical protein
MSELDAPAPIADATASAVKMQTPNAAIPDPSKTRLAVWLPIVIAACVALGGSVSWVYSLYEASTKQKADDAAAQTKEASEATKAKAEENARLLNTYLLPIQLKLKLSLSIYKQLSDHYLVPGYGILESYVKMAREQGSDKVALQYGLITDLVGVDSQIEGLLEGYDPSHLTTMFKSESDKFLDHAQTYIIRFKAVPKVITSGGELPIWKPFPAGFPSALEDEIARRQGHPIDTEKKVTFTEPGNVPVASNPGREFTVVERSGWRQDGLNAAQWCDQAIKNAGTEYPGASISIVSSSDSARQSGTPIKHAEYQYLCELKITVK